MRFWNNDIIENRDGVLQRIMEALGPGQNPMQPP
jgi:very-short-patch-repair endonuclease